MASASGSGAATGGGKVTLTTSDAENFEVERDVANRSVLIRNMLEGALLGHGAQRVYLLESIR